MESIPKYSTDDGKLFNLRTKVFIFFVVGLVELYSPSDKVRTSRGKATVYIKS